MAFSRLLQQAGLLLALIGSAIGASAAVVAGPAPSGFFLELDIAIERGGVTGVLFDFGDGIWGENSSVANVPPGSTPLPVRLALPMQPIRNLRFDPTADDQPTLLTGLRVVDGTGVLVATLDPRAVRPMHQIQAIVPEGNGVRITPTPKADDPMLRVDLPPLQQALHRSLHRPTVGRGVVVVLAVGVATLVLIAVVAAWRAHGGASAWVGGLALFGAVFGARLFLLNLYSRPVPYWDEWEGDVLYILIPFQGGFLDWGALVMPQWEHRILLTRIVTLFGTVLNGEWDPRVAMTVSAAMYAATVALVGTVLLATRRWSGVIAAGLLALAASLPFDFNNLLWGGQTQMNGLALLTVCAIGLAAAPRVTPWVRFGALAGGGIALFTMGAGLVGSGCAAGICLVRAAFERDQRRAWFGLAAIFFAVAFAGLFLHVTSRAHVPLYATSFAQFQRAFVGVLAWPVAPGVLWAGVIWLPWIVHGVQVLRRREATSLEWLAVGLGGWGLVNAVALGYARQYEGPPFDSRFLTSFSLGVMGSLASSVALALRARTWRTALWPWLFGGTAAVGLLVLGVGQIRPAQESAAARTDADQRIRAFLTTGDRRSLVEKPPHHTGNDIADRLEEPLFQQIMPAAYRRALAARTAGAVPVEIVAGPLTQVVRALMSGGVVLAAVGWLGLGVFVWRVRPCRLPPAAVPVTQPDGAVSRTSRWRLSLPEHRADLFCYLATAVLTIAWVLIYNSRHVHDGLVDEPGHWTNILHFQARKPGWPEAMPMLPGYHYIVVAAAWLLPGVELFPLARWVTVVFSLIGFAAFALVWRRLHGRPAGRATLLFALLPLTQPFTGMVYTDMPALALALAAFWAQTSGRLALAALFVVGGVAIRQTNLAWAGFFIAWEFLRADAPRATFVKRIGWQVALIGAGAVIVLAAGRLTVGAQHGNDFRFNLATLHFAGLLVLLLGLPCWIAHAPATWRRWREANRARPLAVKFAVSLGALAATGLALTYRNPHIWNRELFWPECSFTLLRNWPLVWIDAHPWLRMASGVNIVLMTVALAQVFARQRHRRELWLALGVGSLTAFTNGLVEPRYFIPAAGFVLVLLDLERAEWRRLAIWWGLLTALHAPFVVTALSLW